MARETEQNEQRTKLRTARALIAAAACGAAFGGALPAQAESAFGCFGLMTSDLLPSVEGVEGQFFRLAPDLHMDHRFSERSIAQIAALSQGLAQRGTELVVLPMPTKGLALPEALPPSAALAGYQPDLAATLYDADLLKFAAANVAAADARGALRAARLAGAETFFGADHRMTPAGARAVADAVGVQIKASPRYETLQTRRFQTGVGAREGMPSLMAQRLQQHCALELPAIEAALHQTASASPNTPAPGASLFDGAAGQGTIALVGTEMTGARLSNFAGFLAEATALPVAQYTVFDGGPFAAISSYLTSAAFAAARPSVLVWEIPVWEDLARHGDQPVAELVAAAGAECQTPLRTVAGLAPHSIEATLAGIDLGRAQSLLIDTGGADARSARVSFARADGTTLIQSIYRHPGQRPTSRFFLPVADVLATGVTRVSVALDVPMGASARLAVCSDEGES